MTISSQIKDFFDPYFKHRFLFGKHLLNKISLLLGLFI
jgi:hypothetical protein